MMPSHLLSVEGLQTRFKINSGYIHAVNGLTYDLDENEIVAIVGESGCGKTASQLSIMRLISYPGEIVGGRVLFEGNDLFEFPAKSRKMCEIRGRQIAMIFQEPASALNPVLTIGRQIGEMLERHLGMNSNTAKKRSIELLTALKIPHAEDRLKNYPYQFSGGMLQRVMIAMALSCYPKLLIADEPTSALDVTTQAQILELLVGIVLQYRISMTLVTHNLGIAAKYATKILIMYAGQVIESGSTTEVFGNPCHPYSIGLFGCIPKFHDDNWSTVVPVKGAPPNLMEAVTTCAFLPRCEFKLKACSCKAPPPLIHVNNHHYVRCYKYEV